MNSVEHKINKKFWKTEWLIIGLGSFSLNLYFFLINSYSNTFFFTFLIISISIIVLTLKLYDNESQRESAFDILNNELGKIKEGTFKYDNLYPIYQQSKMELMALHNISLQLSTLHPDDKSIKELTNLTYEVLKETDDKTRIYKINKIRNILDSYHKISSLVNSFSETGRNRVFSQDV